MPLSLTDESSACSTLDPAGAVERAMGALCGGDDPLSAILREHLESGGKRIRANLAFQTTTLLGGHIASATLWAAACELLHNATLIHDDLQDGDEVRRGQPTVWAKHGAENAITAGDMMLMLPYLAIDRVPVPAGTKALLHECVARRAIETAIGQATELEMKRQARPTRRSYERSASGKTGQFFGLPVEGAMLIVGTEPDAARLAGTTFEQLGVFFQMLDDVVDLFGEKGRNEVGCDIREGKVSALVITHIENCPSDADWLMSVLRTPREETTLDQIEMVRQRLVAAGTLTDTLSRALALLEHVRSSTTVRLHPELNPVIEATAARSLRSVAHLTNPQTNTHMEQRDAS